MWPRSLSAAAQSFSSKPSVAPFGFFGGLLAIGGLVLEVGAHVDFANLPSVSELVSHPLLAHAHPIRS